MARVEARTPRTRLWRAAAALAALLSALVQLHAGTANACTLDVITLKSLSVEVKSAGTSYSVGDVAEFSLTVTRPGREDAVGLGIPVDSPTSSPAEGLHTGVVLTVGDEYLFEFGSATDDQGRAGVRIKLAPPMPVGEPAHVVALSWKTQVQGPCFVILEHGSVELPGAFTVRR